MKSLGFIAAHTLCVRMPEVDSTITCEVIIESRGRDCCHAVHTPSLIIQSCTHLVFCHSSPFHLLLRSWFAPCLSQTHPGPISKPFKSKFRGCGLPGSKCLQSLFLKCGSGGVSRSISRKIQIYESRKKIIETEKMVSLICRPVEKCIGSFL